jgi:ribosomal protein S18 acetylase RimI-like enzyme
MPQETAKRIEEIFAVRAAWLPSHLPRAVVRVEPRAVVIDSGFPSETFNVVCRARLGELPPSEQLDAIEAIARPFRNAARPFAWWIGAASTPPDLGALLERAGLPLVGVEPAMVCDLAGAALSEPPPDLEIRTVRTAAELADFAGLLAAVVMPPDPAIGEIYAQAAAGILAAHAPARFFVGYVGGEAVATGELFRHGALGGIYNVATHPSRRGLGYGRAMTIASIAAAREVGLAAVTLTASKEGLPLYRRLGFSAVGELREHRG